MRARCTNATSCFQTPELHYKSARLSSSVSKQQQALVAQQAERRILDPVAAGSIPVEGVVDSAVV